jgi:hypothetical protein
LLSALSFNGIDAPFLRNAFQGLATTIIETHNTFREVSTTEECPQHADPVDLTSANVKGFGCRPLTNGSAGTGGRRPKASKGGKRGR